MHTNASNSVEDVDAIEKVGVPHKGLEAQDVKDGEVHDAVFGLLKEGEGAKYRNVGWIGTSVLLMKTQIGLGALAIPSVFQALGLVPGLIVIIVVGAMTTWSDWVVGTSKRNHPQIWGPSEVGQVLHGAIGREIFGAMAWLYFALLAGSGLLSLSISLNAVSVHALCTAGWVAIVAVIGFALASIQTLDKVSWLGWVGMVSVISALGTVTIAVGLQDRPAEAPQFGEWDLIVVAVGSPTFAQAMNAIATVVLAFAGTPAFYPVIAEMRNPRDYNKAMGLCQIVVTLVYTIVGVVVYTFCGQYVANPALGSAGPLLKRIAYGIAMPALFATVCIYSHMSAKYIFVRLFRGKAALTDNSFKHWVGWLSCCAACILFSYVIASAVPVFGGLVGLIGALFATPLSMQFMAQIWIHDNRARWATDKSWGFRLHLAWAVLIFVTGCFFTVGGTYGAVMDLIKAEGSSPWTCADNSNSV